MWVELVGVEGGESSTGGGAIKRSGGGAKTRRAGGATTIGAAITGAAADGTVLVEEALLAILAPEMEGDFDILVPMLFTPRGAKVEVLEATVLALVRPPLPDRSVSLPPLERVNCFRSSRRAFLAALSRTPGHCAGTFISHFEWQE
jgi:hypothetical protein